MPTPSGPGGLLYQMPAIQDAVVQIQQAAAHTDQNHSKAVSILTSNADFFGGAGSAAFEQKLTEINAAYSTAQEAIGRAGYALNMAADGMRETDAQLAAQYGTGAGPYDGVTSGNFSGLA